MKEHAAKRVAVIEDDRDINELVCYHLYQEGFLPTSIYDGQEAKDTLAQEFFDIVVLDLMLPGLDGFTICKYLKQRATGYKTSVIILTAKTAAADKMLAYMLGADCYVTKPFSVTELISIIKDQAALLDKHFKELCSDS